MNYIWDIIIKGEAVGVPKKSIHFSPAKVYSPYMELCNENLNFDTVQKEIEINPHYRFYEIFKDLFNINDSEDMEFKNTLFDILIHYLTELDLVEGMNKKEYYIKFILRDIKENLFGNLTNENMELFNDKEKDILAHNILKLYITGDMMNLLKSTTKKIFKNSMIYANCGEKKELLFYMGVENNERNVKKLELIKELFLPIKVQSEIYWKTHFGVIGVEETMKIDEIALY